MNPDPERTAREQWEARIVAFLVGEASPFEEAELRERLLQDAELAAFHDQMKQVIGLAREALSKSAANTGAAPTEPRLTPERRQALLAQINRSTLATPAPPAPKPAPKPATILRLNRWLIPVGLAASMVGVLSFSIFLLNQARLRNYRLVDRWVGDESEIVATTNTGLPKAPAQDAPDEMRRRYGVTWDRTPSEEPKRAGDLVLPSTNPTTVAWGDYDNDGRLDLFISNQPAEAPAATAAPGQRRSESAPDLEGAVAASQSEGRPILQSGKTLSSDSRTETRRLSIGQESEANKEAALRGKLGDVEALTGLAPETRTSLSAVQPGSGPAVNGQAAGASAPGAQIAVVEPDLKLHYGRRSRGAYLPPSAQPEASSTGTQAAPASGEKSAPLNQGLSVNSWARSAGKALGEQSASAEDSKKGLSLGFAVRGQDESLPAPAKPETAAPAPADSSRGDAAKWYFAGAYEAKPKTLEGVTSRASGNVALGQEQALTPGEERLAESIRTLDTKTIGGIGGGGFGGGGGLGGGGGPGGGIGGGAGGNGRSGIAGRAESGGLGGAGGVAAPTGTATPSGGRKAYGDFGVDLNTGTPGAAGGMPGTGEPASTTLGLEPLSKLKTETPVAAPMNPQMMRRYGLSSASVAGTTVAGLDKSGEAKSGGQAQVMFDTDALDVTAGQPVNGPVNRPETLAQQTEKVPTLGDVPLLGRAFRYNLDKPQAIAETDSASKDVLHRSLRDSFGKTEESLKAAAKNKSDFSKITATATVTESGRRPVTLNPTPGAKPAATPPPPAASPAIELSLSRLAAEIPGVAQPAAEGQQVERYFNRNSGKDTFLRQKVNDVDQEGRIQKGVAASKGDLPSANITWGNFAEAADDSLTSDLNAIHATPAPAAIEKAKAAEKQVSEPKNRSRVEIALPRIALSQLQTQSGRSRSIGIQGGSAPTGPQGAQGGSPPRQLAELQLQERLADKAAVAVDRADPARKPARPAQPAPQPQPEVATRENAFSTFSLNVSDVAFKLAAASLEKGALPEPASIRVEEFINAFDYRDPAPGSGARLAFHWERAAYPFAHNREIVRFSIKTAARGREPGRPLNLVVLLDNSGSMERADRVQIVQEAMKVLARQLQPQDTISVVAFARTARLWVDGMPGGKPDELLARVLGLNPQGGTNLELALDLAYATALKHFRAPGNNRILLLTDGAANLGNVDPDALQKKVELNRQKGIALDCFGVGWEGYNDYLLEVLSRHGDGRYGFLNQPEEVAVGFAAQLVGVLQVAAADVKTQVEFNPRRVLMYRQIGYARHQLTKEQFRDNTVDAAEIGAAESGNALYALQVDPRGEGPLGVVRVRFKAPATGEYVEQEWTVPCQAALVPLAQASPALRLAVSAAAFAEWLSASPFAGEVKLTELQSYLNDVPQEFAPDPRPGKLVSMIVQARALAGK